jgi:DNA-binding MarR family transcriptional regulator
VGTKAVRPRNSYAGLERIGNYETERFYTHRLSLLNRLIARTTKQMLADPFGLSQMEWRILVQLEHRSPSKVAEIHERSLMQKPQISSALPRLIRNGYIARKDDPRDARAPFFAITEEGLKLYRAIVRVSRKRQQSLESLLSEREREILDGAIDRLIASFVRGESGELGGGSQFQSARSRA